MSHLLPIIESIERAEERIKAERAHINQQKRAAKGMGYDTAALNAVLKRRKMTAQQREELDALIDLYTAELGMLGDTPLGTAAIRRLSRPPQPEEDDDDLGLPEAGSGVVPPPQPEEIAAARKAGEIAAGNGEAITANPYPPASALRAAFDEGWCQASASDGMDIPDAWRPTKKPSKKDEKPAGEEPGEAGAAAEAPSEGAGDDGEEQPGAAA